MATATELAAEFLTRSDVEGYVGRIYGGNSKHSNTTGIGEATIGSGYALVVYDGSNTWSMRDISDIKAAFAHAGITLTGTMETDLKTLLQRNVDQLNGKTVSSANAHLDIKVHDPKNGSPNAFPKITANEIQARKISEYVIEHDIKPAIFRRLTALSKGSMNQSQVIQEFNKLSTQEQAAILSVGYQSANKLGPNFFAAFKAGNKADMANEIRDHTWSGTEKDHRGRATGDFFDTPIQQDLLDAFVLAKIKGHENIAYHSLTKALLARKYVVNGLQEKLNLEDSNGLPDYAAAARYYDLLTAKQKAAVGGTLLAQGKEMLGKNMAGGIKKLVDGANAAERLEGSLAIFEEIAFGSFAFSKIARNNPGVDELITLQTREIARLEDAKHFNPMFDTNLDAQSLNQMLDNLINMGSTYSTRLATLGFSKDQIIGLFRKYLFNEEIIKNDPNLLPQEKQALLRKAEVTRKLLSDKGSELPLKRCFAAGTMISLADGSYKPIEEIRIGDEVLAFDQDHQDSNSPLVARKVTKLFVSHDKLVINFHGVKVTPDHVTLCGEGPQEGRFMPLIDIIRSDGTVVLQNGTSVRAATNFPVGSIEDRLVQVNYLTDPVKRTFHYGKIRAGTLLLRNDGSTVSVLDCIRAQGKELRLDGLLQDQAEQTPPEPLMWAGDLPKPEDYILQLSNLTRDELTFHEAAQPRH
ncbi:hypothetical protein [Aestuariispira insulae]|uniref:Hint domain-containing protein n=1 Tax=Aestuariispira insulae TaxID=1461337 RepID=A0A3D9H5C7_9PROT|nr:hypothetical protein [Aestuariispira insulae]RED44694.1 hypothetical protein DFP90_11456 [Aestuariispira insulae]